MSSLLLLCLCLPSVMAQGTDADSLELRLQRLENSMSSTGLLDLFQQVEQLRAEVKALQGELEVQNHAMQGLQQRNQALLQALDTRLSALENRPDSDAMIDAESNNDDTVSAATEPSEETGSSESTDNADSVTEQPSGDDSSAKDAYQSAFGLLRESRYADAVAAFNGFLENYPNNSQADSAQYWLGESYFVQGDFANAISAYQTLLERYPDSRKLSHSTLKLGYCHQELGQMEQAVGYFEQVIDSFPGSSAAQDASSRLRSLNADQPEE